MAQITKKVVNLPVHIFETRQEMGKVAAADAARRINAVIAKNGVANVVFAAAPSQDDLLENLLKEDIDWTKVRGFHQDEYVGIDKSEPAGFGTFLDRAIFHKVPFKELHYLLCEADKAEEKCESYTALLQKYPIDLIFLGIGENGHLAFNDPAVADFNDPKLVKPVQLDEVCRNQQVNDGCFAKIDDVPKYAITLTVPMLVSAPHLFCIVPAPTKAWAIRETLTASIDEHCPASVLRTREGSILYLDPDSASLL